MLKKRYPFRFGRP